MTRRKAEIVHRLTAGPTDVLVDGVVLGAPEALGVGMLSRRMERLVVVWHYLPVWSVGSAVNECCLRAGAVGVSHDQVAVAVEAAEEGEACAVW